MILQRSCEKTMEKELLERAEKLAKASVDNPLEYGGTIYFTRKPINHNALYKNKRYFFCYHNTHTIQIAFRTQKELDQFLTESGF